MKRSSLKVLAMILVTLLMLSMFVACEQQGKQESVGPQGEQGIQGEKGDDGNGISSIIKTSSEGLVDTYTITFTDGTTTTFTVTNGADGKDGVDGTDGKDGQDGQDGQDGEDGVSVVNAYVDENLHLWIVLSNRTKIDAGYVGVTTTDPTPTTYTVTFVDYNGIELKKETVESGKGATAPADPTRSGYRFTGWDVTFDNVTSNITVTAQYEKNITSPTIIVEDVVANINDGTVDVVISIANNPGISSLKLDVTYDSALSLNNIVFDPAFGAYVTAPTPYGSPQTMTCISPLSEVTASGTFATLTFEISDTVTSGTVANISLTLYADEIYDGDFEAVEFETINGTVTIAPNP